MRSVLLTLALLMAVPAASAQSIADPAPEAPTVEAFDQHSVTADADLAPALAVDLSGFVAETPDVLPPATLDVQSPPGDEGDTLEYWGGVAATGAGLLAFAYLTFF